MPDGDLTPAADRPVDDPFEVRKAKLDALRASGVQPYRDRFDRTHTLAQIVETWGSLEPGEDATDTVAVAGRIVAKRDQGKILFIVIRDGITDLQLFCRLNVLGEDGYALAGDLDLGDWIGAIGTMSRTRRGELSVIPTSVVLLSKSLRPLPEKFHGLTDVETRYRQRYVDLIVNPDVRRTFDARFKIISAIRRFMESRGFIEVETPMLHPIPGGASARPFVTHHNALDMDLYLRIAPELYLKRLLVGGFDRVFEINRSFRNEGISVRHNPEFTMLEAYQAFANIDGMMDLTEGMVAAAATEALGTLHIEYQGAAIDLTPPWPRRTMLDLTSEAAGEKISFALSDAYLRSLCDQHGVPHDPAWGKGKLITELYEKLVEGDLVQPTFVTEYPLETSPLARKKPSDPEVTERFELIISGRELANAFSELIDPIDQRERFAEQMRAKGAGDDEAMGYDEDYLRAMEYGMPPAGGMGIGIDRLVMLLTDSASIRDVLLFPHLRPES
ncbi:MAG: lysine--tRNA ligase [Actinomycetia bacterium]|nr:lysine--tRNA ligase [Actinomycetes bacterium]